MWPCCSGRADCIEGARSSQSSRAREPGKPVLATGDGEEACGIIRQGAQLWAPNEGDIGGIVANLRKILADYGRYRLQGQQNWQARQAFTRVRMAEKIENVLAGAMSVGREK